MTATELAVQIWGSSEDYSRSWGARNVRRVARDLFLEDAPGQGKEWDFDAADAATIRRECERRWGKTSPPLGSRLSRLPVRPRSPRPPPHPVS